MSAHAPATDAVEQRSSQNSAFCSAERLDSFMGYRLMKQSPFPSTSEKRAAIMIGIGTALFTVCAMVFGS